MGESLQISFFFLFRRARKECEEENTDPWGNCNEVEEIDNRGGENIAIKETAYLNETGMLFQENRQTTKKEYSRSEQKYIE